MTFIQPHLNHAHRWRGFNRDLERPGEWGQRRELTSIQVLEDAVRLYWCNRIALAQATR